MGVSAKQTQLTGLSRRLVEGGFLNPQEISAAQIKAKASNQSLLEALVESGQIDDRIAANIAAHEFGLPLLSVSALDLASIPSELRDYELETELKAVVIHSTARRIYVAVSDPLNFRAIDELRTRHKRAAVAILISLSDLHKLIGEDDSRTTAMSDIFNDLEVATTGGEESEQFLAIDAEDAPTVRFVNGLLLDAVDRGASDIHIETYETSLRARMRMDGVLQEVTSAPKQMADRIIARIKVMSRMNVAERRVPQDGRFRVKLKHGRAVDFRVSSCPTLFGEKVVLRQLDNGTSLVSIDRLGYEPEQKACFLNYLSKPHGMILVTGPTGSGKTLSLYSGLSVLNTPDRNINTAEDPAEINLPGINQVNVHPQIGLTFAATLKAFLRQDPDVIMVGEIRDLETAEIALKAAQTGHLVLSTLHTNDAPQTLIRMLDMGVAPYSIATSVNLVIAQRLARRLCQQCSVPTSTLTEALLAEGIDEKMLENADIRQPVGCAKCNQGYRGRIGIYQVMPISEEIQKIILRGGSTMDISHQARLEGVDDLRQSGLRKACSGITSLEEINRITID